jgi:hypothetical protein
MSETIRLLQAHHRGLPGHFASEIVSVVSR